MFENSILLLTGGTGSFGHKFVEIMLKKYSFKAIRIYSRDEMKQWEMQNKYGNRDKLRFFVGDVREKERLERAMDGVDIVIHAAALKQVPSCEYNPFEAIKTNIMGSQNVIDSAINHNVKKVAAISTDKAVNPVNLYGATKMCMEKLFVAANSYVGGKRQTRMSCIRYGNVVGSRGSVIPLFLEQRKSGKLTLTHKDMTRFWITLEHGVEFVIQSIGMMRGGEIFVPKAPSMKITDLAKTMAPECEIAIIGIRPGEKIHECLLTEDEARHAIEFRDFYVIEPEHPWWNRERFQEGSPLPEGYRYTSDANEHWIKKEELVNLIEGVE
jgi:UDP-N-acetylglucosamine 4,6-dehydratase